MFQWGHDPEVMVSRARWCYQYGISHPFQWGHDPEVMVSKQKKRI